ncbi:MAG: hypothetical protein PHH57_02930 [Candidatus Omnitrophica bacterium]|nr:hypothetical protein [Candidatus Omnitrophota bacterium]
MKWADFAKKTWEKSPHPVLDVGPSGSWDDEMVDCPFVMATQENSYKLFFTGHSRSSGDWGIGMAVSEDFKSWEKRADNPLIKSGDTGFWGRSIDGAAIVMFRGGYYLFFEAAAGGVPLQKLKYFFPPALREMMGRVRRCCFSPQSQAVTHASGRGIGIAQSFDLVHWESMAGHPVFMPQGPAFREARGIFSPCPCVMDDRLYLFYGVSNGKTVSTHLSTSTDLAAWQRRPEIILEPGPTDSWDEGSVIIVSILALEDAYVAFYEGQDRKNQYAVGMAVSQDCIHWKKHEQNPVLARGRPGDKDEMTVNSPHVFKTKKDIFLFYGARDSKMRGRCMMARLR